MESLTVVDRGGIQCTKYSLTVPPFVRYRTQRPLASSTIARKIRYSLLKFRGHTVFAKEQFCSKSNIIACFSYSKLYLCNTVEAFDSTTPSIDLSKLEEWLPEGVAPGQAGEFLIAWRKTSFDSESPACCITPQGLPEAAAGLRTGQAGLRADSLRIPVSDSGGVLSQRLLRLNADYCGCWPGCGGRTHRP